MASNSRKGPIVDPGLCRCCGATKKCRLMNVEYEWFGQKEVYSEMFVDTFGLLLSSVDGDLQERLICATCVTRLRDASGFRRQVLGWEEKLLQARLQANDGTLHNVIKEEAELKEEVDFTPSLVPEPQNMDDDVMGCDDHVANDDMDIRDNDSDNMPLLVVGSMPKKPSKKVKKEKKSKVKVKEKSKKAREERVRVKREMLQAVQEMAERLKQMEQIEPSEKPRPRQRDTEQKNHHNTIVIVENSFICPFDSSFSDYFCFYCKETFIDPDKLRVHTATHDPTTFKDLIKTKKSIQLDISRLNCRLCQEVISDLEYLKGHLVNAHGKELYPLQDGFLKFRLTSNNLTCTECGSSFSFFHALKKHMAEHFGTCICDVCGAHYFEERMLILHQKSHQKVEENFPCSDCGKSFKSKHSRYLHEAKAHKKEPTFQCPKCDEVFFSYSIRYRHIIESHGELRVFQCGHCERTYDSRKSLREHNRRFHLKVFKHQCDLCDKRFYIPSRLKEHIATHTGERNFRCDFCGKSYPRLRGLKVHLQSHNSEKKFRCMLCSASFTQNANLRNHVKRQHQSLEMEEGFHE